MIRTLPQLRRKTDYIFALIVLALIFFGIVMISSSSMVISLEKYGTQYHYVTRQLGSFAIGVVLLLAGFMIDYKYWKKIATFLIVITLILLILVFIPGIGHTFGGSSRWIGFGNNLFQPSEIIKLTFIIYLAAWLDNKGETIKEFFYGFLPFVVLLGVVSVLIIKEPDLGTTSVILLTSIVMYFAAGANILHLLFGGGFLAFITLILIKAAPYRMQRLLVFLNPSDSQGAAYHINQALLAIGTGGLFGLGFGQSKQKYLYLPMPHTDSIYAIIAEELGFVRASIVLIIFIILGVRGFRIAKNAPDGFGRLLAVGITSWILIQTIINIGSMLGIMPMTGVTLPFISYGGSSLMVLMAAVGIMLNISKNSKVESIK
jgi:cell division protein FtsW